MSSNYRRGSLLRLHKSENHDGVSVCKNWNDGDVCKSSSQRFRYHQYEPRSRSFDSYVDYSRSQCHGSSNSCNLEQENYEALKATSYSEQESLRNLSRKKTSNCYAHKSRNDRKNSGLCDCGRGASVEHRSNCVGNCYEDNDGRDLRKPLYDTYGTGDEHYQHYPQVEHTQCKQSNFRSSKSFDDLYAHICYKSKSNYFDIKRTIIVDNPVRSESKYNQHQGRNSFKKQEDSYEKHEKSHIRAAFVKDRCLKDKEDYFSKRSLSKEKPVLKNLKRFSKDEDFHSVSKEKPGLNRKIVMTKTSRDKEEIARSKATQSYDAEELQGSLSKYADAQHDKNAVNMERFSKRMVLRSKMKAMAEQNLPDKAKKSMYTGKERSLTFASSDEHKSDFLSLVDEDIHKPVDHVEECYVFILEGTECSVENEADKTKEVGNQTDFLEDESSSTSSDVMEVSDSSTNADKLDLNFEKGEIKKTSDDSTILIEKSASDLWKQNKIMAKVNESCSNSKSLLHTTKCNDNAAILPIVHCNCSEVVEKEVNHLELPNMTSEAASILNDAQASSVLSLNSVQRQSLGENKTNSMLELPDCISTPNSSNLRARTNRYKKNLKLILKGGKQILKVKNENMDVNNESNCQSTDSVSRPTKPEIKYMGYSLNEEDGMNNALKVSAHLDGKQTIFAPSFGSIQLDCPAISDGQDELEAAGNSRKKPDCRMSDGRIPLSCKEGRDEVNDKHDQQTVGNGGFIKQVNSIVEDEYGSPKNVFNVHKQLDKVTHGSKDESLLAFVNRLSLADKSHCGNPSQKIRPLVSSPLNPHRIPVLISFRKEKSLDRSRYKDNIVLIPLGRIKAKEKVPAKEAPKVENPVPNSLCVTSCQTSNPHSDSTKSLETNDKRTDEDEMALVSKDGNPEVSLKYDAVSPVSFNSNDLIKCSSQQKCYLNNDVNVQGSSTSVEMLSSEDTCDGEEKLSKDRLYVNSNHNNPEDILKCQDTSFDSFSLNAEINKSLQHQCIVNTEAEDCNKDTSLETNSAELCPENEIPWDQFLLEKKFEESCSIKNYNTRNARKRFDKKFVRKLDFMAMLASKRAKEKDAGCIKEVDFNVIHDKDDVQVSQCKQEMIRQSDTDLPVNELGNRCEHHNFTDNATSELLASENTSTREIIDTFSDNRSAVFTPVILAGNGTSASMTTTSSDSSEPLMSQDVAKTSLENLSSAISQYCELLRQISFEEKNKQSQFENLSLNESVEIQDETSCAEFGKHLHMQCIANKDVLPWLLAQPDREKKNLKVSLSFLDFDSEQFSAGDEMPYSPSSTIDQPPFCFEPKDQIWSTNCQWNLNQHDEYETKGEESLSTNTFGEKPADESKIESSLNYDLHMTLLGGDHPSRDSEVFSKNLDISCLHQVTNQQNLSVSGDRKMECTEQSEILRQTNLPTDRIESLDTDFSKGSGNCIFEKSVKSITAASDINDFKNEESLEIFSMDSSKVTRDESGRDFLVASSYSDQSFGSNSCEVLTNDVCEQNRNQTADINVSHDQSGKLKENELKAEPTETLFRWSNLKKPYASCSVGSLNKKNVSAISSNSRIQEEMQENHTCTQNGNDSILCKEVVLDNMMDFFIESSSPIDFDGPVSSDYFENDVSDLAIVKDNVCGEGDAKNKEIFEDMMTIEHVEAIQSEPKEKGSFFQISFQSSPTCISESSKNEDNKMAADELASSSQSADCCLHELEKRANICSTFSQILTKNQVGEKENCRYEEQSLSNNFSDNCDSNFIALGKNAAPLTSTCVRGNHVNLDVQSRSKKIKMNKSIQTLSVQLGESDHLKGVPEQREFFVSKNNSGMEPIGDSEESISSLVVGEKVKSSIGEKTILTDQSVNLSSTNDHLLAVAIIKSCNQIAKHLPSNFELPDDFLKSEKLRKSLENVKQPDVSDPKEVDEFNASSIWKDDMSGVSVDEMGDHMAVSFTASSHHDDGSDVVAERWDGAEFAASSAQIVSRGNKSNNKENNMNNAGSSTVEELSDVYKSDKASTKSTDEDGDKMLSAEKAATCQQSSLRELASLSFNMVVDTSPKPNDHLSLRKNRARPLADPLHESLSHGDNSQPRQLFLRKSRKKHCSKYFPNKGNFNDFKSSKVAIKRKKSSPVVNRSTRMDYSSVLSSSDDSDDADLMSTLSAVACTEKCRTRFTTSVPVPEEDSRKEFQLEDVGISVKLPNLRTSRIKSSLDDLLAEKILQQKENLELDVMQAELKEGIRKGGLMTLSSESIEADDLLPEHRQQLQMLELSEQKIRDVPPGEVVFMSQHYCKLFSEFISLHGLGFVPGQSYTDRHLANASHDRLDFTLNSDILSLCFSAVSQKDTVLRWLFFLMSVHHSNLLINKCKAIIMEFYNDQTVKSHRHATWAPDITDILRVFINFGAQVESLVPRESLLKEDALRDIKFPVDRESIENIENLRRNGANRNINHHYQRYNRENLRLVLHIIAFTLQARPRYTSDELTALMVMLCKIALDVTLSSTSMVAYEIQTCIAAILEQYTDAEWNSRVLELCQLLPQIADHHHNKLYITQLLPLSKRGLYLQRRLGYSFLRHILLGNEVYFNEITDLKIHHLFVLMPQIQILANEDSYVLSSTISLLNVSVGNDNLKSSEREDLTNLREELLKIVRKLRDNVQMIDRTKMKGIMTQVSSKWALKIQSMGTKQKSLFAWTKQQSPQKVKVETVNTTQSDAESVLDDSDSKELDLSDEDSLPEI